MSGELSDAVAWAERVLGKPVREAEQLSGGWTSTMLRLTLSTGTPVVMRLMTKEPWRTHAPALLVRESETQRQLMDTGIPAPVSHAVDPDGVAAGTPAHLMSLLPGRLELVRDDDDVPYRLARLLAEIHGHDPGSARPRDYQSWATAAKRVVPSWARDPAIWKTAFSILEGEPPPYQGTFLHRDFHLGNVLWSDGAISGAVDWVETSWGPAGLDVAHSTTYLAMLHGPSTAERFVQAYQAIVGVRLSQDHQRYWEVMDIVGYLPDPAKVAQPWRDTGRDISDHLARRRLEQHLVNVVEGSSEV